MVSEQLRDVSMTHSRAFYSPDAYLSGDSHENTVQLPVAGKFNVFVGDLINPKHWPKEGTDVYDTWKQGFTEKVSAWTESVNRGETIFLLGNHEAQFVSALVNGPEAANNFLYSQKTKKEKGMATLKAVGVTVPEYITEANYPDFVGAISENETLHNYAEMLWQRGRLYTIVNDVYLSHTLPVTDSHGRLLPLTEDGEKGMDALDVFERSLRVLAAGSEHPQFDEARAVIRRLATKEFDLPGEAEKQVLGPLWVRETQRAELLRDRRSVGTLIDELDLQARKRDARVFATVHGHVHKGGEIIYGKNDKQGPKGVIVNIDYSQLSQHRKRARLMEQHERVVLYCPSDERGNHGGLVQLGSSRLESSGEIFSCANSANVRARTPHPQLASVR